MDKRIKDQWIADLRSGNYDQCTGSLKYGNSFCCLGVLAYISEPSLSFDTRNAEEIYTNVENMTAVNNKILYGLNDAKQYTFPLIADWIEKNIPNDE